MVISMGNISTPSGTQAELLLQKVREADFVLRELVLYLDTHPGCRRAMAMYSAWQKQYKDLKNEYEKTTGPLCAFDVSGTSWSWCERPWPWMDPQDDAGKGVR